MLITMEQKIFIYKITNKINEKVYIGQTDNLERRWREHISISKNPNNVHHYYLHRAMACHGIDIFLYEVLEEIVSNNVSDFDQAEIKWISTYDSKNLGYNLTDGGSATRGFKHSQSTKDKMSENNKGKLSGNKNSMFGKQHSQETRQKYPML